MFKETNMGTQNRDELNRYITELSKRKPVRTFKSDKGYDRTRDRKDPKLYEIEENNSAVDEKS